MWSRQCCNHIWSTQKWSKRLSATNKVVRAEFEGRVNPDLCFTAHHKGGIEEHCLSVLKLDLRMADLSKAALLGTVRTQTQVFQTHPFAISLYHSAWVLFSGMKKQFLFLIFSKQQINCLLLYIVCSLCHKFKDLWLINMKED